MTQSLRKIASFHQQDLDLARKAYFKFINSTYFGNGNYIFTKQSEISPFARCFAIFGLRLLLCDNLKDMANVLSDLIIRDLDNFKKCIIESGQVLKFSKPYLQLLTFSLSALAILDKLDNEALIQDINSIISTNYLDDLFLKKAFDGYPQSGNYAMFVAILALHISKYGNQKVDLSQWEEQHLRYMNKFGFWGEGSMSHLQFQNGFHQYQVFDYLGTKSVPWEIAADSVSQLADYEGHYSPYIGGGGCYDYDAIFFLTSNDGSIKKYSKLLVKTANTLLSEQNEDGGFCESKKIRPRSFSYFTQSIRHVFAGQGAARLERLHQMFTLLRPKHNSIHTHWTRYSRDWAESNLWDSWFRMLTIARIDIALNPENVKNWGFINYPGIGFHSALRK